MLRARVVRARKGRFVSDTLGSVGLFLLGIMIFSSASRLRAEASAADGAKELQGTWKVWRSEDNHGMTAGSADSMVIDEDKVQFLYGGNNKGASARFVVRSGSDPKEIEFHYTSGSENGKTRLAIWRITKPGQLEVCWAPMGEKKVPRKFSGRITPGAGENFVIYRREDFKEAEEVVREFKKFEGRWGSAANAGDGMMIEDDAIQFLWGGNNKGAAARFIIDPTKNPKTIDLIYTRGSENRKHRVGIYRLQGNTLEIALSEMDSDTLPRKLAGPDTPGGGKAYFKYLLKEK